MLILTRFWGLRPSFGPKEADFSPVSPPLSSVQLGSVCPESDDKTQFDSIEFTCCNKAKDPANNGNTLARQKAELSLFDKLLWEALRDGNFSTFRTLELQSPDSKLLVEAMVESYSSFLIQEAHRWDACFTANGTYRFETIPSRVEPVENQCYVRSRL
ncbi:hypothetical protein QR680_014472 [Steinernema hermaphroditum]|uniref:Uncharacterized protein n=1 Tax=Steinernema hermaphroditum TaxID=289476 RepID=A0AA39M494_9BILA|nr:hypothetical protein QR680_014472 [Steinernema hermaphroditum]